MKAATGIAVLALVVLGSVLFIGREQEEPLPALLPSGPIEISGIGAAVMTASDATDTCGLGFSGYGRVWKTTDKNASEIVARVCGASIPAWAWISNALSSPQDAALPELPDSTFEPVKLTGIGAAEQSGCVARTTDGCSLWAAFLRYGQYVLVLEIRNLEGDDVSERAFQQATQFFDEHVRVQLQP